MVKPKGRKFVLNHTWNLPEPAVEVHNTSGLSFASRKLTHSLKKQGIFGGKRGGSVNRGEIDVRG